MIARRQLVALGVAPSVIDYRVKARRLIVLYPGVYAVGHARLTRRGRWIAAVLACGGEAALSHRTAAALHDLRPTSRARIDVTVPGARRKGHPGIDLHRTRSLHAEDVTVVDGIRVTSIARTLLDLAEVVSPLQLRRAFEQAERMGRLDHGALVRLAQRSHGRRGLKHLLPLVTEDHADAARARSELEARFRDFLRDRRLPLPAMNVVIEGYEVDAHWSGTRLIAELDSWRHHRSRTEFDRDRRKWLELKAAGYEVLSITDPMLRGDEELVASTIRAALPGSTA